MKTFIGRLIYGDKSYFPAHLVIGFIIMGSMDTLVCFVLKQSPDVFLKLVSSDMVGLSASLLGFQLTGVSILIAMDGNKKLQLLREINSETMIYKVFISSIAMFLCSIILMIASLNLFPEECIGYAYSAKRIVDFISVISLTYGFIFLVSSIRLLRWFCSK